MPNATQNDAISDSLSPDLGVGEHSINPVQAGFETTNRDYPAGFNNANGLIIDNDLMVLGPDDLPLHPDKIAVHEAAMNTHTLSRSILSEIEGFIDTIVEMKEEDYGDWMRRANIYLTQLTDAVHSAALDKGYVDTLLTSMKDKIQYRPNFEINETRAVIIDSAVRLLNHFGGSVTGR